MGVTQGFKWFNNIRPFKFQVGTWPSLRFQYLRMLLAFNLSLRTGILDYLFDCNYGIRRLHLLELLLVAFDLSLRIGNVKPFATITKCAI